MNKKRPTTYKDAGVDIDAADSFKKKIAALVRSTETEGTLGTFGLFGGAFELKRFTNGKLTLVASIDGVGTKTMIAVLAQKYDTVGIDIVSHCVNDILCQGARPLFFLDYIAAPTLKDEQFGHIIEGIVHACKENRLVLLGGETAEMPGVYKNNAFDLVGAIVGVLDQTKFISGQQIQEGDVIIGLPSVGLHTNGFSLVRKVLLDDAKLDLSSIPKGLDVPLVDELLRPHHSYLEPVSRLLNAIQVKGLAHITGGGIPGNLSRIIPNGLSAKLSISDIPYNKIFDIIQELGNVPTEDMYHTFNMGIGMICCVSRKDADKAIDELDKSGNSGIRIGQVEKGTKKVVIH